MGRIQAAINAQVDHDDYDGDDDEDDDDDAHDDDNLMI